MDIELPSLRSAALALQDSDSGGDAGSTAGSTGSSGWGSFGTQKRTVPGTSQSPSDSGVPTGLIMAVAGLFLLFAFVIPASAGCAFYLRQTRLSDFQEGEDETPQKAAPKRSAVACASTAPPTPSRRSLGGESMSASRSSSTGPAVVVDPLSRATSKPDVSAASQQQESTVCVADTRPGTPYSSCSTADSSGNKPGESAGGSRADHLSSRPSSSMESWRPSESSRIRAAAAVTDSHAPPPRGSMLSSIKPSGGARPVAGAHPAAAHQQAAPAPPKAQNLFPTPPRADGQQAAALLRRPRPGSTGPSTPAQGTPARSSGAASPAFVTPGKSPPATGHSTPAQMTPQPSARGNLTPQQPPGALRGAADASAGSSSGAPAHGQLGSEASPPRAPPVVGSMASEEELAAMQRRQR